MRTARLWIPALAAAGILCSAVLSAAFPHMFAATRSFSFDGRRYALIPSGENDLSLVRRELAKAGIQLPQDSEKDPPPHPALSFVLAQEGEDRRLRRFPIPASFGVEHTLRLAGDGGEVEILFGITRQPPQAAARLLRASGWSCPDPADRARRGTAATCTHGKERHLAFLEAKGGGFLLVRRVDR